MVLATRAMPEFWLGMVLLGDLLVLAGLVPGGRHAVGRHDYTS